MCFFSLCVWQGNASHHERAILNKAMYVVTETDSHISFLLQVTFPGYLYVLFISFHSLNPSSPGEKEGRVIVIAFAFAEGSVGRNESVS